jgi:hypothetical protein
MKDVAQGQYCRKRIFCPEVQHYPKRKYVSDPLAYIMVTADLVPVLEQPTLSLLQYSAMDLENEPQHRRMPTLVQLCQRGTDRCSLEWNQDLTI